MTFIGSIPAGTRKANVRLQTVNRSGSNSTYPFDDIALEIGTQQAAPLAPDDLAGVDLATTAPVAGDTLMFDGASWVLALRRHPSVVHSAAWTPFLSAVAVSSAAAAAAAAVA